MKFGTCVSIAKIEQAKELGFDMIELPGKEIASIKESEWPDTKSLILKSGIKILGFNAYCDEQHPLVGPNVNNESNISYLEMLLTRAHDLKCSFIGIGAPEARVLPEDYEYAKATSQMEFFLYTAAAKAKPLNITILYEAINPFLCNFGNSFQEIYETVNSLDLQNLKIVWDVYHSELSNEPLPENYFDLVEHVHICSWDSDLNRLFPSRDDLNLLEYISDFLSRRNYNRTLSIEADDSLLPTDGASALSLLENVYSD